MEVHSHTHTPRKKWTHYFWEFLMLFLAVFCGFTAENIREHQMEHRRTIRYAKQFIKEIQMDTARLNMALEFVHQKKMSVDSLIAVLSEMQNWRSLYYWGLHADDYYLANFHHASFDQIKNSGSLRYFDNEELAELMQEFIFLRENIEIVQKDLAAFYNQHLTPFINKILDKQLLLKGFTNDRRRFDSMWLNSPAPAHFLNDQKDTQIEFRNMLISIRSSYNLDFFYPLLKDKAVQLINLLQKEYHSK